MVFASRADNPSTRYFSDISEWPKLPYFTAMKYCVGLVFHLLNRQYCRTGLPNILGMIVRHQGRRLPADIHAAHETLRVAVSLRKHAGSPDNMWIHMVDLATPGCSNWKTTLDFRGPAVVISNCAYEVGSSATFSWLQRNERMIRTTLFSLGCHSIWSSDADTMLTKFFYGKFVTLSSSAGCCFNCIMVCVFLISKILISFFFCCCSRETAT